MRMQALPCSIQKRCVASLVLEYYTDKSLASISFYPGFSSPSHILRVFEKHTGILPC